MYNIIRWVLLEVFNCEDWILCVSLDIYNYYKTDRH
jgi:hypothetical protein